MKKALTVLGKLAFWLYFIYNVGVIQKMISIPDVSPVPWAVHIVDKDQGAEDRQKHTEILYRFYQQKVAVAKFKFDHQGYTPFDYFTDMRAIDKFRERNGIEETIGGGYFDLEKCMRDDIGHHGIVDDDIIKARDKVYADMAAYEKAQKAIPVDWKGIRVWFLKLYLKMLPAAIVLLLLWMYEENEYKSFTFKNPISFLFSVLIHPLIIAYIVAVFYYDRGKEALAEIEVRRTKKKLFSLLSEDEIALVKHFAKSSLSLKQFRQQLITRGRVVHHSFILTCIVTVILHCAPGVSNALQTEVQLTICITAYQYDYHDSTAVQWKQQPPDQLLAWRNAIETVIVFFITVTKQRFKHFSLALLTGHPSSSEPIPLKATSLFV